MSLRLRCSGLKRVAEIFAAVWQCFAHAHAHSFIQHSFVVSSLLRRRPSPPISPRLSSSIPVSVGIPFECVQACAAYYTCTFSHTRTGTHDATSQWWSWPTWNRKCVWMWNMQWRMTMNTRIGKPDRQIDRINVCPLLWIENQRFAAYVYDVRRRFWANSHLCPSIESISAIGLRRNTATSSPSRIVLSLHQERGRGNTEKSSLSAPRP